MSVTDGSASEGGVSTGSARRTPSVLLAERTKEELHMRQGRVMHDDTVQFKTYAVFRHGAHHVVQQSVGYSSDGDLVLDKTEAYQSADNARHGSQGQLTRVGVEVDAKVCLNDPKAKPKDYHTDGDAALDARRYKHLKKYPGVKNPKNKKVRNRLRNDHMAAGEGRFLYKASVDDSDDDDDAVGFKRTPIFGAIPDSIRKTLHREEGAHDAELEKLGLDADTICDPLPPPASAMRSGGGACAGGGKHHELVDASAAAARFNQLPANLKGELHHAMTTTFMPQFIQELDQRFARFISGVDEPVPVTVGGGTASPCTETATVSAGTAGSEEPFPSAAAGAAPQRHADPQGASLSPPSTLSPTTPVNLSSGTSPTPAGAPTPGGGSGGVGGKKGKLGGKKGSRKGSAPTGGRTLEVICADGYGRLVCHGVAQYYRLFSASETRRDPSTGQDVRVTVVSCPKKTQSLPPPSMSLHDYLMGGRLRTCSMIAADASSEDSGDGDGVRSPVKEGRAKRFTRHSQANVEVAET